MYIFTLQKSSLACKPIFLYFFLSSVSSPRGVALKDRRQQFFTYLASCIISFIENLEGNVPIIKRNGTHRLQVSPPEPDLVLSNFERGLGLVRAHMSIGDLFLCSAYAVVLGSFASLAQHV